jgi:hypothetical protein
MSAPSAAPPPVRPPGFMKWQRRVLGICLILFSFELGLILLFFPWRSSWDLNWIPLHEPRLARIWMSGYFRGALNGLGLLNIYVALSEARRQITSLFRSPES